MSATSHSRTDRVLRAATITRAAPRPLAAGETPARRIGPWELVRPIFSGPLSCVYEARAAGNVGRPPAYAVKVLDERWHDEPQIVGMFRREAIVGRSVSHPHLISILNAHVQQPPYYVVSPLLPGLTLAEHIQKGRPSLAWSLWVARQVAAGLAALHAQGWIHGDVKPANIVVSRQGHATLLDLGFARRTDESCSAADRPVQGTLNYLAPEFLTSVLRVDQSSDLYSLGATLFESLTSEPPFSVHDWGELALAHRHGARHDIRALLPTLPQRVALLIERLLANDPLRRPASAQELVNQLISLEIATLDHRLSA